MITVDRTPSHHGRAEGAAQLRSTRIVLISWELYILKVAAQRSMMGSYNHWRMYAQTPWCVAKVVAEQQAELQVRKADLVTVYTCT